MDLLKIFLLPQRFSRIFGYFFTGANPSQDDIQFVNWATKKSGLTFHEIVVVFPWNPNDPCFAWKRHCFGGFNHQNRGQTGSRYIFFSHKEKQGATYNIVISHLRSGWLHNWVEIGCWWRPYISPIVMHFPPFGIYIYVYTCIYTQWWMNPW